MMKIDYIKFTDIKPEDFLPVLNNDKLRLHLMAHDRFTLDSLVDWMDAKLLVDSQPGCKVRGILCEGELAGWCAIQLEAGKYELAMIIHDSYWGVGKNVFSDMMGWARDFNHDEVSIHFLHTRPRYKFLTKLAKSVQETELYGNKFVSYQLAVI